MSPESEAHGNASSTSPKRGRVSSWKHILAISATAGAGFALTLAAIIGVALFYESRPKPAVPWNRNAIKATFDYLDTKNDGTLQFNYVLENTADADYSLEDMSDVEMMAKLERQKSLTAAGDTVETELPIFLPSHRRLTFDFSIREYKYPGSPLKKSATREERQEYREKVAEYVRDNLKNLEGFVLYDKATRYEIDFPKGW